MLAIVCDRCGKVIADKDDVKDTTKITSSTLNVGDYDAHHLCKECMAAFVIFMYERKEQVEGGETDT